MRVQPYRWWKGRKTLEQCNHGRAKEGERSHSSFILVDEPHLSPPCKQQKEDELRIKLLLLGAGESGKSTIFKQVNCRSNFCSLSFITLTSRFANRLRRYMGTVSRKMSNNSLQVSSTGISCYAWRMSATLCRNSVCQFRQEILNDCFTIFIFFRCRPLGGTEAKRSLQLGVTSWKGVWVI